MSHPLAVIAYGLGLRPRGGRWGPCPACDASLEGRRPPVRIYAIPRGERWACNACGASGDAVALLGHHLGDGGTPRGRRFHRIREALEGVAAGVSAEDRAFALVASKGKPPPPPDLLEQIRRRCRPVTDDDDVAAWLRSRGIDPEVVERHRLAGALAHDSATPRSRVGGQRRRVVVPCYNHRGELASVRFRAHRPGVEPKELAPRGYTTRGAVMADPEGRDLLAGDAHRCVLVVEGVPAWLAWATTPQLARIAVLGVASGSWTPQLAERIPADAAVVLDLDPDQGGEALLRQIRPTLDHVADLRRTHRPPDTDADDLDVARRLDILEAALPLPTPAVLDQTERADPIRLSA